MTDPLSVEDALAQLEHDVKAGEFANGRTRAEALLEKAPDNQQARYLLAVCLRYLKQYSLALTQLEQLIRIAPNYGRAYQECGHNHRSLKQNALALRAFHQAVTYNPALLVSWQHVYQLTDSDELKFQAKQQCDFLQGLPRELQSVNSMMHEGKLYKAEQLCRSFLKQHPQHIEGMRLLAALGLKNGIVDDAEFILESAVSFAPDHHLARLDYVNVLYRRQKFAAALEQAEILRHAKPGNTLIESAYANQCVAVGRYDIALPIYQNLIRQNPRDATLHLSHGHALKTIGELEEGIAAYRRAYAARKDFGDAYWSLANLKTYRFTPTEVEYMLAQEAASGIATEDRLHFCFALGKHFEDQQDFSRSFNFYERGNQLRKSQQDYSAQRTRERLGQHKSLYTADFFSTRHDYGTTAPDPIFIVGMPRAGSTLLEQILASHSQVDGTMELQNITTFAQKLEGRRRRDEEARYPTVVETLTKAQAFELGQRFIEETQIHRQGAAFFIDKLPNNFIHIGLIHLILPRAKIIDARRHPMACCVSNFKQLYASGQEYTYSLHDVGQYYHDYVDFMRHWDSVLPGRVLRVQHEDVINDTENQVRRVLDYCGLPFQESCLRFYETKRSVKTPSAEQVRQPIYRSGMAQWRHFDSYLSPLKQALGSLANDICDANNSKIEN